MPVLDGHCWAELLWIQQAMDFWLGLLTPSRVARADRSTSTSPNRWTLARRGTRICSTSRPPRRVVGTRIAEKLIWGHRSQWHQTPAGLSTPCGPLAASDWDRNDSTSRLPPTAAIAGYPE